MDFAFLQGKMNLKSNKNMKGVNKKQDVTKDFDTLVLLRI